MIGSIAEAQKWILTEWDHTVGLESLCSISRYDNIWLYMWYQIARIELILFDGNLKSSLAKHMQKYEVIFLKVYNSFCFKISLWDLSLKLLWGGKLPSKILALFVSFTFFQQRTHTWCCYKFISVSLTQCVLNSTKETVL